MYYDKKNSHYLFEKKKAADARKLYNGIGKKPRKTRVDKGKKRYPGRASW